MKLVASIALVITAACGSTPSPSRDSIPLEVYRATNGTVVAFAASGKTAILRAPTSPAPYMGQPADLVFVERSTARVIASAKGFAIGQPGDAEAYALVENRVIAMVSRREVPLDLPAPPTGYHWRLVWSTVDHVAGTALLAFDQDSEPTAGLDASENRDRNDSRFELVEVDTRTMSLRGRGTISRLGSRMTADEVARAIVAIETENGTKERYYSSATGGCAFAANGSSVYLTCRKPEPRNDKVEHWVTTRYDGRTVAWSIELEAAPDSRGGDIEAAVTADGKTLVIAHGLRRYDLLRPTTTTLVDTARGTPRTISRPRIELGDIAEVLPVPGTSLLAQIHRYAPPAHSGGSDSFHGISLLDATTGAIRVVLDTSTVQRDLRSSIPDAAIVLANGTYLLAM